MNTRKWAAPAVVIAAWAQNLTDENYVDRPLQSGAHAAFLGAPRAYGVTLRTRF